MSTDETQLIPKERMAIFQKVLAEAGDEYSLFDGSVSNIKPTRMARWQSSMMAIYASSTLDSFAWCCPSRRR